MGRSATRVALLPQGLLENVLTPFVTHSQIWPPCFGAACGAVAGAAVGANVGRDDRDDRYSERAVQRCEQMPSSGQPDYWDVEYNYRGQVFNTQLNYAPGPQIPVRVSIEPE